MFMRVVTAVTAVTPQMACRGKGFVRLNAKQPALRYLSRLLLKLPLAASGRLGRLGTAWDGSWDGKTPKKGNVYAGWDGGTAPTGERAYAKDVSRKIRASSPRLLQC